MGFASESTRLASPLSHESLSTRATFGNRTQTPDLNSLSSGRFCTLAFVATDDLERIPWYTPQDALDTPFSRFAVNSSNAYFRRSNLTWISLVILLLAYPAVAIATADDPSKLSDLLTEELLLIGLIATVFMQWSVFLLLYVATFRERTGLAGLGLGKLRAVDFLWVVAFLVSSNLILAGLAWGLAQIGLPMPGEIALLIPQDTVGRIVWVAVSATAGFCEEIGFRGYLMTRLRLIGKTNSWVVPTVVSALAFGLCHAYQGLPGIILITVYGLMFSLLYLRTGRLWPCILAHFFQDFGALFYPQ